MADTVQRAKEALWGRYHELNPNIFVDAKGYVNEFRENLLQPEWMELIIKDYEKLMAALGNRCGWVEYCFYNPLI